MVDPDTENAVLRQGLAADTSSRVQGNLEAISIEDLGTIRVKIWRRTNFRRGTCEMDDFEVHVTDVGVLDEKLLKGTGLTHTVRYIDGYSPIIVC